MRAIRSLIITSADVLLTWCVFFGFFVSQITNPAPQITTHTQKKKPCGSVIFQPIK